MLITELNKFRQNLTALFDISSFANPVRPGLSVNILCKNNINSIEACLQSILATQADSPVTEIILVDTGSTDGTLELLYRYQSTLKSPFIKIIRHADFKGYSYHRNEALAASNGDWVLVLDSDEYLSSELRVSLRKLISSKIFSAYKIYRRWILEWSADQQKASYLMTKQFAGRYKGTLRLFRKFPGLEFRGDIHEALFGLETKRVCKLGINQNTIYHLDVAINNFGSRQTKVAKRESLLAGSGHPEEYLPELFKIKAEPVPEEDLWQLQYITTDETI